MKLIVADEECLWIVAIVGTKMTYKFPLKCARMPVLDVRMELNNGTSVPIAIHGLN